MYVLSNCAWPRTSNGSELVSGVHCAISCSPWLLRVLTSLPSAPFRRYHERLACMDECFSAFESVAPHHEVARACYNAACSERMRDKTGRTGMECFERCTHHAATRVPKEDWRDWSELLSTATCPSNLGAQVNCTRRTLVMHALYTFSPSLSSIIWLAQTRVSGLS